jgi:m7GpppX diphosphatase
MGMTVGQAHMLDDVISLVRTSTLCAFTHRSSLVCQLELDEPTGPSILQRMTLSYGLGEQHGLFSAMQTAQSELLESGDV